NLIGSPLSRSRLHRKPAKARRSPEAPVVCMDNAQLTMPRLDLSQEAFGRAPRHGQVRLRWRPCFNSARTDHDLLRLKLLIRQKIADRSCVAQIEHRVRDKEPVNGQ